MKFAAALLALSITAFAADSPFQGKWSSTRSENGGDLRLTLEKNPSLTFTLGGEEIKTTIVSSKLSESAAGQDRKFTIEYRFTIADTRMISLASGTIKDGKMEGKYETRNDDDRTGVDEGKFTASVVK